MAAQSIRTIKIFYCYTQEDDALREQLARHLSPFRRLRYITGWYNRDIQAGGNWIKENEKHLDVANIILLLLSANFFASDHHYTVEMERAISRHKAGTACVIPILLRPVEWKETPVGELSALPANGKPVTQWTNQDEAWLNVVQGIREVVKDLVQKQPLSLEENDVLYPEQGPLSGQIIGKKYLLGELLGEGVFSEVYKAQHILMRRQQAIKVLHERHFRKQEFRDRFLREARTIASLDHHYIIHLDDFWTEASQAYLVMPFMSGGTLQGILDKQQGFLEPDQVIFYVECVCNALDYAHKKGIVHLDLKPLNLLVHEDGRLLLSDFGLAHLMKQGAIIGGSSLRAGTPHYMAPEHINGSPEKQSDLFSLGVLLYQMLVGQLPFDGLPQETILLKNMTEWPPAPRSLRPDLPQSVENMLKRALAKQPGQRYQTANEFLIALKNALEPSLQAIMIRPTPATPVTPVPVQNTSAPGPATTPQNNPNSLGDLPDWLVDILRDADKAQAASAAPPISAQPTVDAGRAQPVPAQKVSAESLLSQIAGASRDELLLNQVADSVLASTASLPKPIRIQVIQSMQDIQRYVDHGLLTAATEECLRVIDMAPQYLDIHQVLCEIDVRQGKVEQAIAKYAILIDTYISNERINDAITCYQRIHQLEPNNLTYHMRLINRLASQGEKLADIYLRRNQLEQASETLRRIGNIYAETDSPAEAVMNLRRAAELDPTNIDLLREFVGFCYQFDRPAEANTYQEKIARYYFDTHQVKEAVSALQQLIAQDRNNFEAYDMLGQTYQSVGEYEQASRVYKNLGKVNPGSLVAHERLAKLQDLRSREA